MKISSNENGVSPTLNHSTEAKTKRVAEKQPESLLSSIEEFQFNIDSISGRYGYKDHHCSLRSCLSDKDVLILKIRKLNEKKSQDPYAISSLGFNKAVAKTLAQIDRTISDIEKKFQVIKKNLENNLDQISEEAQKEIKWIAHSANSEAIKIRDKADKQVESELQKLDQVVNEDVLSSFLRFLSSENKQAHLFDFDGVFVDDQLAVIDNIYKKKEADLEMLQDKTLREISEATKPVEEGHSAIKSITDHKNDLVKELRALRNHLISIQKKENSSFDRLYESGKKYWSKSDQSIRAKFLSS